MRKCVFFSLCLLLIFSSRGLSTLLSHSDPNAPKSAVDLAIDRLKAGKRRKKDDMEEQDRLDIVKLFIDKCLDAARKDATHNQNRQPALEKMKLLEHFVATLQQVDWHEIYLDEHVLRVFSAWLRPLPDGSLPNLRLRSSLFQLLNRVRLAGSPCIERFLFFWCASVLIIGLFQYIISPSQWRARRSCQSRKSTSRRADGLVTCWCTSPDTLPRLRRIANC